MSRLLEWIVRLSEANTRFVVAFYTIMVFFMNYTLGIIAKIDDIIALVDAAVSPVFSGAGTSVSPLSLMNYFLPLSEAITLMTAWMAFYILCYTIRIFKAWIPTLS